jgi:hypothetical protein
VLHALCRGDRSVIPADGIIGIPARTIRKADAEAFWTELKARIKAGKEAPSR